MAQIDDSIVYMFDSKLLEGLDLTQYNVCSSYLKPGDGLILRPMSTKDFQKGFIDVVNQLTLAGDVTEEKFQDRFNSMKKAGCYYPLVVEDTEADSGRGRIVATGTLIVEEKFIHTCALRGRVEEVVVDSKYRGQKLGKIILAVVTALSKKLTCYKTTLECKVENIGFYQIFGYVPDEEKFMQCRFRQ
ncbi:glucosamine 6-phosphate N-acetyltransferase-like [Styela clava]|uniref:glucosamine 6-phosphate N-acetyltransferase-like n=1 Tax=Styela clava TaxID=7725 RepID=UPI00193A7A89|nr:glucosamine 6-phosphate N-acetyltransferase-like [Styela clava]